MSEENVPRHAPVPVGMYVAAQKKERFGRKEQAHIVGMDKHFFSLWVQRQTFDGTWLLVCGPEALEADHQEEMAWSALGALGPNMGRKRRAVMEKQTAFFPLDFHEKSIKALRTTPRPLAKPMQIGKNLWGCSLRMDRCLDGAATPERRGSGILLSALKRANMGAAGAQYAWLSPPFSTLPPPISAHAKITAQHNCKNLAPHHNTLTMVHMAVKACADGSFPGTPPF